MTRPAQHPSSLPRPAGYLVPIRIACIMEVYVEAPTPAEAKRRARAAEWDDPGELAYEAPARATVTGEARAVYPAASR